MASRLASAPRKQGYREAAAKQHDVLTDHGNPSAQLEQIQFTQVHLTQQHPPGLRIVMALQQIDQRRFADAGTTAERHFQTIRNDRLDPVQRTRAPRMAEVHIIEAQLSQSGNGRGVSANVRWAPRRATP